MINSITYLATKSRLLGRKQMVVWLLICITNILVACTSLPQQPVEVETTTSTLSSSKAKAYSTLQATGEPNVLQDQFRWLQKVPCAAPCIEGMTPGTTTSAQVVESLRNNPRIVDIETGIVPKDIGYVTWKWQGEGSQGETIFDASSVTQTIRLIRLTTSRPFSLDEVVKSYGEPSHVMISAGRGPDMGSGLRYSIEYVYLDYGLRLKYRSQSVGKKPVLSSEMQFGGVDFFAPSKEGLVKDLFGINTDSSLNEPVLVPWQGFRDFDFYCKQVYRNEPDRCK